MSGAKHTPGGCPSCGTTLDCDCTAVEVRKAREVKEFTADRGPGRRTGVAAARQRHGPRHGLFADGASDDATAGPESERAMTLDEYRDSCTDEPASRICVTCRDDEAGGGRKTCDGCERSALGDAWLALKKLHDPEDMGVADQREDMRDIMARLEVLEQAERRRIESVLFESLTRRLRADVEKAQWTT